MKRRKNKKPPQYHTGVGYASHGTTQNGIRHLRGKLRSLTYLRYAALRVTGAHPVGAYWMSRQFPRCRFFVRSALESPFTAGTSPRSHHPRLSVQVFLSVTSLSQRFTEILYTRLAGLSTPKINFSTKILDESVFFCYDKAYSLVFLNFSGTAAQFRRRPERFLREGGSRARDRVPRFFRIFSDFPVTFFRTLRLYG